MIRNFISCLSESLGMSSSAYPYFKHLKSRLNTDAEAMPAEDVSTFELRAARNRFRGMLPTMQESCQLRQRAPSHKDDNGIGA